MRNALPAPTAAGGGGGGGACGWACGWGGAAAGAAAGTGGTLGAAAAGGAAGGAKGTWKAAAAAAGGGGAGAGGAGCGSGLTAAAKTCGACCWSWLSPTRPPPPGAPAGAGGAWWCCWPPACCGCCGCCCCWTAAAAAAAAAASVGSIRPFQARVGEGKDHLLRVASTQGTREDTWGSSRGRESPLAPGRGLCGCSCGRDWTFSHPGSPSTSSEVLFPFCGSGPGFTFLASCKRPKRCGSEIAEEKGNLEGHRGKERVPKGEETRPAEGHQRRRSLSCDTTTRPHARTPAKPSHPSAGWPGGDAAAADRAEQRIPQGGPGGARPEAPEDGQGHWGRPRGFNGPNEPPLRASSGPGWTRRARTRDVLGRLRSQ